jgi:hypothetical protein
MRTKALLLAAAFTVATCATSMAQVYSANAVGYVNITLPAGFSIIANPLNGTNNNIKTILPVDASANNLVVFKYNAAAQAYFGSELYLAGLGWLPGTMDCNPGDGLFLDVPATAAPLNITFVGEVPQGNLSLPLVTGFNLVGSQVPQALPTGPATGGEDTLEFPAANNDQLFFYNSGNQAYDGAMLYLTGLGWLWTDPDTGLPGASNGRVVDVAEGFFVQKAAAASWDRNFSVN